MTKKSNTFKPASNSYALFLLLLDLFVLFISLWLAATIYDVRLTQDYLVASLIIALVFLYTAQMLNLYRSWRSNKFSKMIFTAWICIVVSFITLLFLAFVFKQSETFSRVVLTIWGSLSLVLCFFWRWLYSLYRKNHLRKGHNLKNVAILGANQIGANLREQIKQEVDIGYNLLGFFDDREPQRIDKDLDLKVEGSIEEAVTIAKAGLIQTLFIVLPLKAEARIAEILTRLGDTTVDVHIVPDFLLHNLVHSRIDQIGDMDTLSVFESPYHGAKDWVKRTEDILLSALILLLISLPLVLIGLLVKLTSKGPIIFKQLRYGLGGEEILVWKFRSMTVGEKSNEDKVVQAKKNDTRITPLGGFLRRTSLDELPQFINVLTGEMSIVGPRPHAVSHNEEYREKVAFYMLRHKVKPGITGWAQVNGWRGETDTLEKMEKRVEFDLAYIKNWSLLFDIKIIFLTIFKGFINKNAY
jgi:putative colanic acid biosysnthesis UDP-glucose lipid carrier transferase